MGSHNSRPVLPLESLEPRFLLSTVFQEGFEGDFPGTNWAVNTSQGRRWDETTALAHSGNYSAHCAETATGETTGDYVNSMTTWMQRSVDLSPYADAALNFSYWLNSEEDYDYLRVSVNGSLLWNQSGNISAWRTETLDLTAYAGLSNVVIHFEFRSDFANNGVGAYLDDISLTTTGDLNDTLVTATRVAVGDSITGVSIFPDTNVHLYSFDVTAGQRLSFDIDIPAGSPLNSYIRLFDRDGNQLAANDDGVGPVPENNARESYLDYFFANAGRYYLGVSSNANIYYNPLTGQGDISGGTAGAYSLTIDEIDVDDAISEAQVITMGTSGPFSISTPTDVDMYALVVPAGANLAFDIDRTQGSALDSYLRIFDSDGQELASNDDGAGPAPEYDKVESYLSFTFADGGMYYIGVSAFWNTSYNPVTGSGDVGGRGGAYTLTVTEIDGDDQVSEARSFAMGDAVRSEISRDVDVDLYAIDVQAGQQVKFDVDVSVNSPLNPYLRLFDGAGTQLAFNDNGVGPVPETNLLESYMEYTFASSGRYFVGVSNSVNTAYDPIQGTNDTPGGTTGDYTLRIFTGTASDTDDPDDEIAEANPVNVGTTIRGFDVSSGSDVDMFSFFATQGQRIGFDIDLEIASWDPYIRLFDSRGVELAKNDDGWGPSPEYSFYESYLAYTFEGAGTYYLGVSAFGNEAYNAVDGTNDSSLGTGGPYTLTLTQLQPGQPAPPTAVLDHPVNGGSMYDTVINTTQRYLDITFTDRSGTGIDINTIVDPELEFTLSGPGVGTVQIASTPLPLTATTFRYGFTGDFQPGAVIVSFPGGVFADNLGSVNLASTQGFTVNALPAATDTTAPTSSAAATAVQGDITVTWSGQDEVGGSGLATFDVFMTIDGGAPQALLTDTTLASTVVTGLPGHTYGFYSIAVDAAGNREAAPAQNDATVVLWGTQQVVLSNAARNWAFIDNDFNIVRLTWAGPGTATVTRWVNPADQRGDIRTITIDQSTGASTLTLTTQGGPTGMEGVTVNGRLGGFQASTTTLDGNMTVTGSLGRLTLGGAQNGQITIGPRAAGDQTLLVASLGTVVDAGLATQTPVQSLTAASWADTGGVLEVLSAPYISILTVNGNFGPSVTLTGQDARGASLGTARISGQITGGQWQGPGTLEYLSAGSTAATWGLDFTGRVNYINVAASLAGTLRARWFNIITTRGFLAAAITTANTNPSGNSITMLSAVDASGSTIDVPGNISILRASRWSGGEIKANRLLTALMYRSGGLGGDFGADLTLLGADARGTSVGTFNAAGVITGGVWTMPGGVSNLATGGSVATWQATSLGTIASLTCRGTLSGQVTARSIGLALVIGNIDHLNLNLTQPVGGTAMNFLYVTRWITDSQIYAFASISRAMIGGMQNSNLFAGVLPGLTTLPALAADIPSLATIQYLTIIGSVNSGGFSYINSNVAASRIVSATIRKAGSTTTGNLFGLAARSIGLFIYTDSSQTTIRRNLTTPGVILAASDFVARTV